MRSTHSSSSRSRPPRCAIGRKSPGGIRPCSGCGQRTSASAVQTRPSGPTTGWYSSTSASAAIAARSSASSSRSRVAEPTTPSVASATPPRLDRFASCIATSANRSRSAAATSSSAGGTATPTDAVSCTGRPRTVSVVRSSPATVPASASGPPASAESPLITTNSSAPSRAAVQPTGQLALQPAGQGDEQVVARLVPQRGVDAPEVVEVAADHGDPLAAGAGEQPVQQLQAGGPVGQPGQLVDGAGAAQQLGGAALLADVGAGEQPEPAVVVQRRRGDGQLAPHRGAVAAQQRHGLHLVAVRGAGRHRRAASRAAAGAAGRRAPSHPGRTRARRTSRRPAARAAAPGRRRGARTEPGSPRGRRRRGRRSRRRWAPARRGRRTGGRRAGRGPRGRAGR